MSSSSRNNLYILLLLCYASVFAESVTNSRSLLQDESPSYIYTTNITLQIDVKNLTMDDAIIVESITSELDIYYTDLYNNSHSLQSNPYTVIVTSNSTQIILILTLSTNIEITTDDIDKTQNYINKNISKNRLYIVTIIDFTEIENYGDTNDLSLEIFFIVFFGLFIIISAIVLFWRYHKNKKKDEKYLMSHYKKYLEENKPKQSDKGKNAFPTIEFAKAKSKSVTVSNTVSSNAEEKENQNGLEIVNKIQKQTIDKNENENKKEEQIKDDDKKVVEIVDIDNNKTEDDNNDNVDKLDADLDDVDITNNDENYNDNDDDIGNVSEHTEHDEEDEKAEEMVGTGTNIGEEVVIEDDD